MDGYDIIGDVHGSGYKLTELLNDLGYRIDPWKGVYSHPNRQAVFVGDLIDRGPSQRHVLEIAKAMVDYGSAKIVMGNHELNAIAYATHDPNHSGEYLRRHTKKNKLQHEAFLSQLSSAERDYYLAWFRTMPLWLELDGVRIVHACWHKPSIEKIETVLQGSRFQSNEHLALATSKEGKDDANSLYRAVEYVLKGPELPLSDYTMPPFRDKDGHERKSSRIKWWHAGASELSEIVEISSSTLDSGGKNYWEHHGHKLRQPVLPKHKSFTYTDHIPVVYGHYWRTGQPVNQEDWTTYSACVDFSAVNNGTMVAYQWSGEKEIDITHYHPHNKTLISTVASS
jgi:hypothetical protein